MNTQAGGRRPRWLSIGSGLGAVLAVGLASACGPVSTAVEPSATPQSNATATREPVDGTGQPGPTQVLPATTAVPPQGPGPTLVPVPAYQIIVKLETPSASHRCFPAGSIEVYGTGFPVTVTHEWRYRSATNGTGNGVQLGPEVTHGYNVAGGKAISSQKLPVGNWEVQLRVTSPKLIVTGWVAHNCAAILGSNH
jgi:hypothetical protein